MRHQIYIKNKRLNCCTQYIIQYRVYKLRCLSKYLCYIQYIFHQHNCCNFYLLDCKKDNLVQSCQVNIHLDIGIFCLHQGMSYLICILCNHLSWYIRHKARYKTNTYRSIDNNLYYISYKRYQHNCCSLNQVDYKKNNSYQSFRVRIQGDISIFLFNQDMNCPIGTLYKRLNCCIQHTSQHKACIFHFPNKIQYCIAYTYYFHSYCNLCPPNYKISNAAQCYRVSSQLRIGTFLLNQGRIHQIYTLCMLQHCYTQNTSLHKVGNDRFLCNSLCYIQCKFNLHNCCSFHRVNCMVNNLTPNC